MTTPHAQRRPSPAHTRTGPTRLLLVRHGQTVWHRENRYAGADSDIDLTPAGHAQAERLAAWARATAPDVVASSPVRRAQETAQASADAVGVTLQVVPELREVTFGVAEGHTISELESVDAHMVDAFRADPVRSPFPGSEAPEVAAERGASALHRLAVDSPGGTVLVVAHNTLLRLALCRLLGIPVARYRQVFPRLDNAAVTELRLSTDASRDASLVCLNVPLPPG